jgi:hypothetical protein
MKPGGDAGFFIALRRITNSDARNICRLVV